MDTKPQITEQTERAERYRQAVLMHVKSLPEGEIFKVAQISKVAVVPKKFIREILNGVAGIDQKLLNFGKPNGKVRRTGPIETGISAA